MSLKNRTVLFLIIAGFLTAGVFTILAIAYVSGFPTWSTLCLLLVVLMAITGWIFYYIARQKYLDSINPKKKKSYGTGNRKNRRKG